MAKKSVPNTKNSDGVNDAKLASEVIEVATDTNTDSKHAKKTQTAMKQAEPIVDTVAVDKAQPKQTNAYLLKVKNNTAHDRFEIASHTWLKAFSITEIDCLCASQYRLVSSNIKQMAGGFGLFEVVANDTAEVTNE